MVFYEEYKRFLVEEKNSNEVIFYCAGLKGLLTGITAI
jgi:hypothetical protein